MAGYGVEEERTEITWSLTGSAEGSSQPCYNQVFMAEIRPFRAFRYNRSRVDLAKVVTQPYDKISPEMQSRYHEASQYNLTRIILGRQQENDNPENNVYSRAAEYWKQWRRDGIFQQDAAPSIYGYSQVFQTAAGVRLERRGFIALGRVEDYSAGVVFRHEQTLAKPKADRLELLRATRAHFEQLFLLYEDEGEIALLLAGLESDDVTAVSDEYGVSHCLWRVSDSAVIAALQEKMQDKKLVIADGHHRYETALNFRDECRAASPNAGKDAAHEFVMMTFVSMSDPGLLILPTHRVVHGLASFSEETFRAAARRFFDVDEIDTSLDGVRATTMLRECGRAGTVMLAVTKNKTFLVHHPNPSAAVFSGMSLMQQNLDVVQLHKCLLEGVLGLSEESMREQRNLSYVRDASEAIAQVRAGKADIAFLINPCRVALVRDIAFRGEVMPQKSTDFYPKLLSGLTIYALE